MNVYIKAFPMVAKQMGITIKNILKTIKIPIFKINIFF